MEEFQLVPEGAGSVGTVHSTDSVLELRIGRSTKDMRGEKIPGASDKLAFVVVDHGNVGRFHARLYYEPREDAFFIVGVHKNGTYVDGKELVVGSPERLKNNAELRLCENGPVYRFLLGRDARIVKTAPVERDKPAPEPGGRSPAPGPKPAKHGSVRCPDCGQSIPRAEVDKHRAQTGHKIESWSTTDIPEPPNGGGFLGSTAEFVNKMIPGAGTTTVEIFRKIMDKRVAGKLRLVYALLAVAGLVTGGSLAYSRYRLRALGDIINGLEKAREQDLDLSKKSLKELRRKHEMALALAKRGDAVRMAGGAERAVFSIGLVPKPQVPDLRNPRTTPVFDWNGTAFMVGAGGVLVTNAHVALELQGKKALLAARRDAAGNPAPLEVMGAALRNGKSHDFCLFEIDEMKYAPEYANLKVEEQRLKGLIDAAIAANDSAALMDLGPQFEKVGRDQVDLDVAAAATDCKGQKDLLRLLPAAQYGAKAGMGTKIGILGYPGTVNAYWASGSPNATLTQGFLVNEDGARVVYDAKTGGGYSGSPVFTREMEVVALHSSSRMDGNYAWSAGVKSPVVLDYLKRFGLLP